MTKPNFPPNFLGIGDNLTFLLQMNSETVDLIATDPPWKKNSEFTGTGKSEGQKFDDRWYWDKDLHVDWLDHLNDNWPKLAQAMWNGYHNHSPGMAPTCALWA